MKVPSKVVPSHITASLAQICVSELYKAHQTVTLPLRPHLSHPSPRHPTKLQNMATVTQPKPCRKQQSHSLSLLPKHPAVRRPQRTLPVVSNRAQYRGALFHSVGAYTLPRNLDIHASHTIFLPMSQTHPVDHRNAALRSLVLATDKSKHAGVPLTPPRADSPPEVPTATADAPAPVRRQFSEAQRPKAPEVAPASGYLPFRRKDRQSAVSSARSRKAAVHPFTLAANMALELNASAKTREGTMPGLMAPTLVSKTQGGLTAMPSLARRSGAGCAPAVGETRLRNGITESGIESLPSRGWDSDDSDDSLQCGRRVVSERQASKRATFRHDVKAQHNSDEDTPSPVRKLGATSTTCYSVSCPGKLVGSQIRDDMSANAGISFRGHMLPLGVVLYLHHDNVCRC